MLVLISWFCGTPAWICPITKVPSRSVRRGNDLHFCCCVTCLLVYRVWIKRHCAFTLCADTSSNNSTQPVRAMAKLRGVKITAPSVAEETQKWLFKDCFWISQLFFQNSRNLQPHDLHHRPWPIKGSRLIVSHRGSCLHYTEWKEVCADALHKGF